MDSIPKAMFDEHRTTIEQDVFAIAPKPSDLATMQDLYEIKKLNSRFAPEGDVDELIVQCYAALFVTYATESVRARLVEGGAGVGGREVRDYTLDGIRETIDGSGVGTPPQVEPVVPVEGSVFMEVTNGASSGLGATPMMTAHDLLGRAFTVCRAAPSPKVGCFLYAIRISIFQSFVLICIISHHFPRRDVRQSRKTPNTPRSC